MEGEDPLYIEFCQHLIGRKYIIIAINCINFQRK